MKYHLHVRTHIKERNNITGVTVLMTHGKSEGGMKYAVEDFGPSSETAS